MLSKIFQVLGLSDKDEQIYTVTLNLGQQPASVIAQKTGLKRVDTYNHLEKLCKKGVCSFVKKDGIKHFTACQPSDLLNFIEDRRSLIKEAQDQLHAFVPKILSKSKEKMRNTEVKFHKGEDTVIAILERFHKCQNKLLRFYGSTINVAGVKIGSNNIDYYIKNRTRRKIKLKQLVPDNEYSRRLKPGDSRAMRETKLLPHGSDPSATLLMYDNEIVILINDDSFSCILVKSPDVAEMFRGFFDMLWESL